jgi:galactokinase
VPGRIEFLGKHTDYAGGRSLVCATGQGISVTAREIGEPVLRISDLVSGQKAELALRPDLDIPRGEWVAYPATVVRRFVRDFGPLTTGLDLAFSSDLPQDAGLSSSGALIVSVALALADANRLQERSAWRNELPDREALAGYLGAVENGRGFGSFPADGGVGTQGGSQDHTAILCSRPGKLLQYGWIPVRLEREVPFPPDHVLAVAVSGVEAAKTREAMLFYNRLAEDAADLLAVWRERSARDDPTLFAALSSAPDARARLAGWLDRHDRRDALLARLKQFSEECFEIIPAVADALAQGNIAALGALVDRSQSGAEAGLRNQVPETIHLQRSARELGAVAASAFGAGFGGSVWAMVPQDLATAFLHAWLASYRNAFPSHTESARFLMTTVGSPAANVVPAQGNESGMSRRSMIAVTGLVLAGARAAPLHRSQSGSQAAGGSDPWLEIDAAALRHNAQALSRLAGGRPILAVLKNNAYGLGLETAGPLFDAMPQVWGFGVVRPGEAIALRAARVRKPIVLMGPASDQEAEELVGRNVRLAPCTLADGERLVRLAARIGRPVEVHLYVDTGMHRMGLPHTQVLSWLESSALRRAIRVEGAFTELVEDQEFDREQATRLARLAETGRSRGVPFGHLHAASSDAVLRPTPETFLDLIRPGLALYGGYPTAESFTRAELRPGYRLKARVIRLDRLEAGEGVSYHRRYKADRPGWVATLGIGHVDGYPSGAVKGCEVLIGGRTYPVVGTVSASHTVVALGAETAVGVGDEAVLVGPDRPSLHPNVVAERSGWSEYNMFMHLNPGLTKRIR